ncbi:hypothetical protein HDU96_008739 [Phlyctochytrium bullatum]|nr:hypothetical protein HDU96_008739 [Phlyctochytrium bullatum]
MPSSSGASPSSSSSSSASGSASDHGDIQDGTAFNATAFIHQPSQQFLFSTGIINGTTTSTAPNNNNDPPRTRPSLHQVREQALRLGLTSSALPSFEFDGLLTPWTTSDTALPMPSLRLQPNYPSFPPITPLPPPPPSNPVPVTTASPPRRYVLDATTPVPWGPRLLSDDDVPSAAVSTRGGGVESAAGGGGVPVALAFRAPNPSRTSCALCRARKRRCDGSLRGCSKHSSFSSSLASPPSATATTTTADASPTQPLDPLPVAIDPGGLLGAHDSFAFDMAAIHPPPPPNHRGTMWPGSAVVPSPPMWVDGLTPVLGGEAASPGGVVPVRQMGHPNKRRRGAAATGRAKPKTPRREELEVPMTGVLVFEQPEPPSTTEPAMAIAELPPAGPPPASAVRALVPGMAAAWPVLWDPATAVAATTTLGDTQPLPSPMLPAALDPLVRFLESTAVEDDGGTVGRVLGARLPDEERVVVDRFFTTGHTFPFEVFRRGSLAEDLAGWPRALRFSNPPAPRVVSERFYGVARTGASWFADHPSLPSLQALLLMTIFAASVGDNDGRALFRSMAFRMATYLKLDSPDLIRLPGDAPPNEQEEDARDRCWRACVFIDNIGSVTTGLPRYFHHSFIPITNAGFFHYISPSDLTKEALMYYLTTFSDVMHAVKRAVAASSHDRIQEAEGRLTEWRMSLPPELDVGNAEAWANGDAPAKAEDLDRVTLHMGYHACVCLLYRARAFASEAPEPPNTNPVNPGTHLPSAAPNPSPRRSPPVPLAMATSHSITIAYRSARLIALAASRILTIPSFESTVFPLAAYCVLVSGLVLCDLVRTGTLGNVEEVQEWVGKEVRVLRAVAGTWGMVRAWVGVLEGEAGRVWRG